MQSGMCACMGPQNGEPLCPCKMRDIREHERRKLFQTPIRETFHGCICPPTSEQTCQSPLCPRKNWFYKTPPAHGTAGEP